MTSVLGAVLDEQEMSGKSAARRIATILESQRRASDLGPESPEPEV